MADRPRNPEDEMGTADRFDRYLDALVSGARPSPDDVGPGDEAEMARTAAELAGATGTGQDPDPAFVEQLRLRMRQADAGIASVQTPLPVRRQPEPVAPSPLPAEGRIRISRRALLQGGLGAAAGLAAGALGMSVLRGDQVPARQLASNDGQDLVKGDGFWQEVAAVADVPAGAAVRFTTAAFDGYVVNDAGQIRALSSVCTHMGCTLHYRPDWNDLRCPCHGASFDLTGQLANGRDRWKITGGYSGDAKAYPVSLPPLVRPKVKVEGGMVFVWTAQV